MFKQILKETMNVDQDEKEVVARQISESYAMNFEEVSNWMTGADTLFIDEMRKFIECDTASENRVLEGIAKVFTISPKGWQEAITSIKKNNETRNAYVMAYTMQHRGFTPRKN